nr:MAG TPA: hypothetical protein [Bacteriophage sp.]
MPKVFKCLEEMKPYYNENADIYVFDENLEEIDIIIDFDLYVSSGITAGDITANNITAGDITANNITAGDITANNISANNITAGDITANNIIAGKIRAMGINAMDITYHGVCVSHKNFVCNSIQSERSNWKYLCLESDVLIK